MQVREGEWKAKRRWKSMESPSKNDHLMDLSEAVPDPPFARLPFLTGDCKVYSSFSFYLSSK